MAMRVAALAAYRMRSGIYLGRDTVVALPWRDAKGRSPPANAVTAHQLYFEGEIDDGWTTCSRRPT